MWATIFRISKPRISVQFKIIAYFAVLIGIAFLIVMSVVMRVTTDYLLEQRVKEELSIADSLSIVAAPFLAVSDTDGLYNILVENGRDRSNRVMVIGTGGTVLADGQSGLVGVRLGHAEIEDIRSGARDRSYGFHRVQTAQGMQWVGYFTSAIHYNSQKIGILMVSSSIQDLMDRLTQVKTSLLLYFALIMFGVVYAGAAMSGIITKPINALTQVLSRTSRGDFSARVSTKGSDELARLGRTFNMMSERLENQDRMKNDFISNASHELKTPLSAMKILVEALIHQKEFDPVVTLDFLTDVDREIDRLSDIVSDLLVLVRFDSQAVQMDQILLPLHELLEDTGLRLAPVAREAGIGLTITKHAPCYVMGDYGKLQQVFYNLIDNAIKYTPRGGTVRVDRSTMGEDVSVSIIDTGIGISQEDLTHIFDRFYRVDKARSRATGGTGLGLSIARNIIATHGGDIQVDSKEGEGSVFTVTLPAHKIGGEI